MRSDASLLRARWIAMLAASAGCASTTTTQDAAAPQDVPATDTPRVDATVVPDVPPAPDVVAAPDLPNAIPPPPVCANGSPGMECFTRAALEQMLRFPGGGPASDAGLPIDAGYAPNGCMLPRFAQNSCCNSAQSGPWVDGDRCCYWFCAGACCGRPFTVAGRARVAEAVADGSWLVPCESVSLDDVTRAALAAAWRADALMEHASVASFARATLAMMAAGAPADLLADTQRAAVDEVDHARRCFTLASRYGGAAEGAGPLDLRGALDAMDLPAFAVATLREGCVGETLAAWTAAAQRDRATDPAVGVALTAIAADETRHAELAWRTVAWCLRVGGPRVRAALDVAARGLADGSAAKGPFSDAPAGVDARAWAAHGRLDAVTQAGLAREAWHALVAPCLAALLFTPPAAERAVTAASR